MDQTKITIKVQNGKWTVNGHTYQEMDLIERYYFHKYFREVKAYGNPNSKPVKSN